MPARELIERPEEGIEEMLKVQSCSSTSLSPIYNVNGILSPERVLIHDSKTKGTNTKPNGRTASKEGGESIPQKETTPIKYEKERWSRTNAA